MKIMLVRGNPRKKGYTQYVTDFVVEGAKNAGAEIIDIDLSKKKINQCNGCYNCWTQTPGKCIHNDDMTKLLENLIDCDILLCTTPLYHYSMSSQLKAFFERTFPLIKPGIILGKHGNYHNDIRYKDKWQNKKLAFITAGAFRNINNFDSLKTSFEYIAEAMHMEFAGNIIRPESYLIQFSLSKPKTIKIMETAFTRAGMELATVGKISESVQEKASISLIVDTFLFEKYSKIYWEHFTALGRDAADLDKVHKVVIQDMRILMYELARSIDPIATQKLKAIFLFHFPDKKLYFCITVNKGKCTIEENNCKNYTLKVTVDSILWGKAFIREIQMKDLLMQRKIKLEGEKMLFTRLDRYFPPPVS